MGRLELSRRGTPIVEMRSSRHSVAPVSDSVSILRPSLIRETLGSITRTLGDSAVVRGDDD
jgi:hypothetical protein